MGKVSYAAGFAAGYVLGARAGRQRYDQISQGFSKLMSNPKVQETKDTVQHQATGLIGKGKEKVTDKVESRKHGSEFDSSYDVVEIPDTSTTGTGTTGGFGTGTSSTGTTGGFGTTETSGFGTTGTSSTDRPSSGL